MNKFRKIARFRYKNKRYQLFMSESNKTAFLEIRDGKYYYPELNELLEINYLFNYNRHCQCIKKDSIKYYSFVPKAVRYGILVTLTSSLLAGCGAKPSFTLADLPSYQRAVSGSHDEIDNVENTDSLAKQENDKGPITNKVDEEFSKENNTSNIVQEESDTSYVIQEVDESANNSISNNDSSEDKYLELLATADDEFDFRYASDFEDLYFIKRIYVRDAKSYQQIYGYSNVTIEQIKSALDSNPNINKAYKDFILQYVIDWSNLYPGSDFSTFYHNLPSLEIRICTKDEMARHTLDTTSVACYIKSENVIYVLDEINLNKESEDYIEFTHELTHSAKNAEFEREDGYHIKVGFYDDMNMGMYIEEALITDFCYELQGLGKKSKYYTLQSSYFRIILDAIDYDGADFMNHSVNYLIEKMDEYMDDEQYAYHIISLIDAEAALRYTPQIEPEFEDFFELYQYITRMYVKNNITSDMSYDEAMAKYDDLVSEITYRFDKMAIPYNIDLNIFYEEFEKEIEEMGISNTQELSR